MRTDMYEFVEDGFAHLKQANVEWARAWDRLSRASINDTVGTDRRAAYCRDSRETWQYMGTMLVNGGPDDGKWLHEFRHRHHPVSKKREVVQVPALCTP